MKKVVAVKDESSHWYVIPSELYEKWYDLMQKCIETENEDDYDAFNDEFSKYRTGGDLNNVQLYAEIEP